MSAIERMTAYHLARLKDKNPDVRLKSIEELVLLEATGALDALEELYRTDPEHSVRVAAQQAGRTLFLKMKTKDSRSASDDEGGP